MKGGFDRSLFKCRDFSLHSLRPTTSISGRTAHSHTVSLYCKGCFAMNTHSIRYAGGAVPRERVGSGRRAHWDLGRELRRPERAPGRGARLCALRGRGLGRWHLQLGTLRPPARPCARANAYCSAVPGSLISTQSFSVHPKSPHILNRGSIIGTKRLSQLPCME